jgi:divalent anion:Na+ symporter, DASS family
VAVHYVYASMTAQIVTLYPIFLTVAIASGVPPLVAALALAFFSNLNASVTHYGSGSGPVLFEAKYLSQLRWWRTGFVVAIAQIIIWLGIGVFWWRVVGLY